MWKDIIGLLLLALIIIMGAGYVAITIYKLAN